LIMKSGNPDVYRPPGGRTERDVAAEVIVRLLEADELHRTPAAIARACAAVGVPVPLVRRVWATRTISTTSKLDGTLIATGDELPAMAPKVVNKEPLGDQEEPRPMDESRPEPSTNRPGRKPRYSPNYDGNTRKANEARRAAKEPVEGMRTCNRCGELKPKSDFNVSSPRTQKLRPECKACNRKYHRDRYLSSEQQKKLGAILRFILEDGDEHLGYICPDCRQPCRIGDEVIATDAVLHHASHHEVSEP
jgi:hypothetical protein